MGHFDTTNLFKTSKAKVYDDFNIPCPEVINANTDLLIRIKKNYTDVSKLSDKWWEKKNSSIGYHVVNDLCHAAEYRYNGTTIKTVMRANLIYDMVDLSSEKKFKKSKILKALEIKDKCLESIENYSNYILPLIDSIDNSLKKISDTSKTLFKGPDGSTYSLPILKKIVGEITDVLPKELVYRKYGEFVSNLTCLFRIKELVEKY